MPESLEEQCRNVFTHARNLLLEAAGSTDHIAKMNFHLARYRDRDALNQEWTAMFPDPANRPARQVFHAQLDGGALIHCDLVAVLP